MEFPVTIQNLPRTRIRAVLQRLQLRDSVAQGLKTHRAGQKRTSFNQLLRRIRLDSTIAQGANNAWTQPTRFVFGLWPCSTNGRPWPVEFDFVRIEQLQFSDRLFSRQLFPGS